MDTSSLPADSAAPAAPQPSDRRFRRVAVAALLALNVVLLVALIGRYYGDATAKAQVTVTAGPGTPTLDAEMAQVLPFQAARPSEYLMIPAQVTGTNQEIIYIIDTGNGDLSAIATNNDGVMEFLPAVRLSQIFENAARGR